MRTKNGYQYFFAVPPDASGKRNLARYDIDEDRYFSLNKANTGFEIAPKQLRPDLSAPFTVNDLLRDKRWSDGIIAGVKDAVFKASKEQVATVGVTLAVAVVAPYAAPALSLAAAKAIAAWKAAVASVSAAGAAAARVGAQVGMAKIAGGVLVSAGTACAINEVVRERRPPSPRPAVPM